jgi:hypothetical protein
VKPLAFDIDLPIPKQGLKPKTTLKKIKEE